MIRLHDAIFALNSSIKVIRGDVAYDINDNVVEYDMAAAESKLAELQEAEASAQAAKAAAANTAISKLSALGLTADEIAALRGL
jgi:hypothetical protein